MMHEYASEYTSGIGYVRYAHRLKQERRKVRLGGRKYKEPTPASLHVTKGGFDHTRECIT
jgi:hypothetical protein